LRILHILRSPIGGLFRHVSDLARGQTALGHEVGVICDSITGSDGAVSALKNLEQFCKLGIVRLPITTKPSFADFAGIRKSRELATKWKVDVIHGHGAKGGLYARMAQKSTGKPSVYTPHGGSLHYNWLNFPGFLYMATEWYLLRHTAGLAFVCDYEKNEFIKKIGRHNAKINMVHNGLWPNEFKKIPAPDDAHDILFVGELCHRKGVDLLINAIAKLTPEMKLSAALIGDGPDTELYRELAQQLNVADRVHFYGRKPFSEALNLGKLFLLPSRAEAFPYVTIEAIASGKTTISTDIAGVGEVLPPEAMYETESVPALVEKLRDVQLRPTYYQKISDDLYMAAQSRFSAEKMVQSVTDFYRTLA
jgi:glycosyltransferase involved in cell wall biosynthesis